VICVAFLGKGNALVAGKTLSCAGTVQVLCWPSSSITYYAYLGSLLWRSAECLWNVPKRNGLASVLFCKIAHGVTANGSWSGGLRLPYSWAWLCSGCRLLVGSEPGHVTSGQNWISSLPKITTVLYCVMLFSMQSSHVLCVVLLLMEGCACLVVGWSLVLGREPAQSSRRKVQQSNGFDNCFSFPPS